MVNDQAPNGTAAKVPHTSTPTGPIVATRAIDDQGATA